MITEHNKKFGRFLIDKIKNFDELNILEFGVNKGYSTKAFLDLIDKRKGHLYSVDIFDYSNLFKSKNWTFIKSRDDDFNFLDKQIKKKINLIFLDSLHEANHVEKIIYHFYSYLQLNGLFFIDDISWIPYLKNSNRDSFYCEVNNKETFEKIISIYSNNFNLFDLDFTMVSTGMAMLTKKSNSHLNPLSGVKTREYTIKNFIRKLILLIK